MKTGSIGHEEGRRLKGFVVLKSYDGGKRWERERQCRDFQSAAGLAEELRSQHPYLRFRVDVDAGQAQSRKLRRSTPRG